MRNKPNHHSCWNDQHCFHNFKLFLLVLYPTFSAHNVRYVLYWKWHGAFFKQLYSVSLVGPFILTANTQRSYFARRWSDHQFRGSSFNSPGTPRQMDKNWTVDPVISDPRYHLSLRLPHVQQKLNQLLVVSCVLSSVGKFQCSLL